MPDPDVIYRHEVTQGQVQLTSEEPCPATFQDTVFCTHGPFIRLSIDRGLTFPNASTHPANAIFGEARVCSDQSVFWIPQISRLAWVMLAPGGQVRLCLTSPSRLAGSDATDWLFLEILPSDVALGGMNFDYPQLALGDGMLYVTMMFSPLQGGPNIGAIILRFSLDQLEREQPSTIGFQYFSTQAVSQFCAALDLGTTCFWAAPLSNKSVRLYSWDESNTSIQQSDVQIPAYNMTDYASKTPDGKDWLAQMDYRITAGARVAFSGHSDDLVFGWTAGRQLPQRPEPYIYLAMLRFDRSSRKAQILGTRDIYHLELAWAFPALGGLPIARGLLALSAGWGGGNKFFANQSVGFVDLPISSGSNFRNVTISRSTAGAPRWGDFLCVRHDDPLEAVFVTAGFSIDASPSAAGSATSSIYVIRFAPLPL